MNDELVIWQDYLDVQADVMPWLQLTMQGLGGETGQQYQNLQLLTSTCCDWVQETLGKPVAPTQFFRRFDGWSGWNGAYIELPYYPILSVDLLTEYRGSGGAWVLTESTPMNQVDGFQVAPLQGRLTRVFVGNVQKPWFPGSRNIEVTWTAGFNPVAPRFRMGTLEMIQFWWRTRQQHSAMRAGNGGADAYDGPFSSGMLAGTPDAILDMLFPNEQIGMG